MISLQRVAVPLFSPAVPLVGMPGNTVDRSALYAGDTIHRIHDIVPATATVALLAR